MNRRIPQGLCVYVRATPDQICRCRPYLSKLNICAHLEPDSTADWLTVNLSLGSRSRTEK